MGYDDAKQHRGRSYTGMRVGGQHDWDYPDGRWREEKTSPDQWSFTFESLKRRRRPAPLGSGVPNGTLYHWLVVANQRVRKVDENTYETYMEGEKWKIAHRRPDWMRWSSERRPQPLARDRIAEILEAIAAGLRAQSAMGAPRLENALDRRVLGERGATLDAWRGHED